MNKKDVRKLADKKHRNESGLFLVEGEKNIAELLESDFVVRVIYGTPEFLETLSPLLRSRVKIELVSTPEDQLVKIGTLQTNNAGIAVVEQKKNSVDLEELAQAAQKSFVLALDDVRDPGNLGTIIRLADWYGVTHVIASETTTDFYNPKTIAASMGSFTRVSVTYCALEDFLSKLSQNHIPVMGAYLDGKNIHGGGLPKNGILIMGSESHGISDSLTSFVTTKITIPKWGKAESLNVSVATGILLDALRRG